MSYPNKQQTPFFGPALLGTVLAVIASVFVAAYLASLFGENYNTRVAIYAGLLTWVIIGAVSVFILTREGQKSMSVRLVVLYFISAWCWPFLLLKPILQLFKKS